MTSAEMVEWLFDDSKKMDADYRDIVTDPFTKLQDVAEQLQELRTLGASKGDMRIDSFLRVYGTDEALEHVDSQIRFNNDTWVDSFLGEDDAGFLRDRLGNEQGNFEQGSIDRVNQIISALEPPLTPPVFGHSQAEAISDVTGFPVESVRDMGVRAVQQALEGELLARIEVADSESELDEILDDINSLPTKAGVRRIKRDVKGKRRELEKGE